MSEFHEHLHTKHEHEAHHHSHGHEHHSHAHGAGCGCVGCKGVGVEVNFISQVDEEPMSLSSRFREIAYAHAQRMIEQDQSNGVFDSQTKKKKKKRKFGKSKNKK